MKHNLFFLFLTGVSASAMGTEGVQSSGQPAFFFVGGCALILLMVARLVSKTKELAKAPVSNGAELSSGYEARYETPFNVGFAESTHAVGGDS